MTAPTVAELSAANMPGLYELLLDEDMTITSGMAALNNYLHLPSPLIGTPVYRGTVLIVNKQRRDF